MGYILVIAQDWLTRSLIAAQLEEEGYEVSGSATVMGAALQLRELGIRPELIIIEALEQDFSQRAIDLLGMACEQTSLILIHGACDYPFRLR